MRPISRSIALLLPCCVRLCSSDAFARRPQAGPLQAELHTASLRPFDETLTAVGTLRANESVTLVSELSRRPRRNPDEGRLRGGNGQPAFQSRRQRFARRNRRNRRPHPSRDRQQGARLLPIALSLGASTGSRQSLGIAVVGGLIFASVLTLFVVPAIYAIFSRSKVTALD